MEFAIQAADTKTDSVDAMERPLVPAGVHSLTIRSVEEGPNEWKRCDENPEGMCLKLRLSTDGNHRFVFDDIPLHLGWRAQQLAAAIGILPVGDRLVLKPEDLDGQVVSVEITHYTSKAGKTSAVVKKYLPAAASASKPKPAAKARPKPVKLDLAPDDIPF